MKHKKSGKKLKRMKQKMKLSFTIRYSFWK